MRSYFSRCINIKKQKINVRKLGCISLVLNLQSSTLLWSITDRGDSNEAIASLHFVQFSFLHHFFFAFPAISIFIFESSYCSINFYLIWYLQWSGCSTSKNLKQYSSLDSCSNGLYMLNNSCLYSTLNTSSHFSMSIRLTQYNWNVPIFFYIQ